MMRTADSVLLTCWPPAPPDLKVSIREIDRKWLTIYLAIRLPRGSKPMPSNAFWRKLLLLWD